MSPSRRCPQCDAPLDGLNPHESCPACLLQLGLSAFPPTGANGPDDDAFAPTVSDDLLARAPEKLAAPIPGLEIVRLLGEGGMGSVYLARQTALDRLVALKFIHPALAADEGFAERFSREAKVLARLNHPHIVTIHDFGQRDGLCYLIMEYVEGTSLRTLLQSGHLAPEQALAIIPQLCEALQYAHDEGVVHRDIKPENILIDRKGRVKIADFGLAKIARVPGSDPSLTATRQVVGTPKYMAPEQMHGARAVDHRADIYSLGVVFYEMLTGELPLGRFEPPSHHSHVDPRLDEVVLRTLERDPDRRYQHASDVRDDVASIGSREHSPSETKGRTASRKTPRVSSEDALRRKDLWGSGAALVILGAIQIFVAVATVFSVRATVSHNSGAGLSSLGFAVLALLVGGGIGMAALITGIVTLVTGSVRAARLGAIALLIPTTPACIVGIPLGIFILRLLQGHGRPPRKFEPSKAAPIVVGDSVPSTTASTNSIFTRPPRKKALLVAIALLVLVFVAYPQWRQFANRKLDAAVRLGDERSVSTWVGLGADVNAPDTDGWPPLLIAAMQGHLPIVERLLAVHATPTVADEQGLTPLMWASLQGHPPVVALLLDLGVPLEAVARDGEAALHKAAFRGHAEVVRQLLAKGAQVNRQDVDGETPLALAAASGQYEIVDLLLTKNADPRLATKGGVTPLIVAAAKGHDAVVERLLPVSRLNHREAQGRTALDVAVENGHDEIIDKLVAAGAAETAPLQFRRGYALARAGKFAAAIKWFEKAKDTEHVKAGAWRFNLDGWKYVIPKPADSLELFLVDCLWHDGKQEDARQRLLKLRDAPPTDPPSLPLLQRSLQTNELSKDRSYSLDRSALAQHALDPGRPWIVTVDFNDVAHGDRMRRETGIRPESRPTLFP